jgi:hypothetical protein
MRLLTEKEMVREIVREITVAAKYLADIERSRVLYLVVNIRAEIQRVKIMRRDLIRSKDIKGNIDFGCPVKIVKILEKDSINSVDVVTLQIVVAGRPVDRSKSSLKRGKKIFNIY